jgi:hypothetical protein
MVGLGDCRTRRSNGTAHFDNHQIVSTFDGMVGQIGIGYGRDDS